MAVLIVAKLTDVRTRTITSAVTSIAAAGNLVIMTPTTNAQHTLAVGASQGTGDADVKLQQSTDGGTTWTDVGVFADQKAHITLQSDTTSGLRIRWLNTHATLAKNSSKIDFEVIEKIS